MIASTASSPTSPEASRRVVWLSAGVILLAAFAAYHNTFRAPFVFDDVPSIRENPSIRDLSDLGAVLSPPDTGVGVTGRPLVNLSLALNYALGGLEVRGYHALNLLIHALNGLLLFGIVRRTLAQPTLRARFAQAASWLALVVATLWVVHPLQTESVTFVVQRTESLVALFYLLTLYAFIRGTNATTSWGWLAVSIFACLAGMATKEVMVTAPVIVLLYDRTFVAGTFRAAWRQRYRYYLALVLTWLLLAYLVALSGGTRGEAAGVGLGMSSWTYLLTQCRAVVLYLKLTLWPHPLVIDYGFESVERLGEVWLQALTLVVLFVATAVAVCRRSALGFIGAWFFVILAPSSSVVPLIAQTIAEHRMYLPLAALVALAVITAYAQFGRRSLTVFAVLALVLGWATVRRNELYLNEENLWRDTLANRPDNPRALSGYSTVLLDQKRMAEALAPLEKLVRLRPREIEARYNLGTVYTALGRTADAIPCYAQVLLLKPDHAMAHCNLGSALAQTGHLPEAVEEFEDAVRLKPDHAEAQSNLGSALTLLGRTAEALPHFAEALRLKPNDADAHFNYGNALAQIGRLSEARMEYETALKLDPANTRAREKLTRVEQYLRQGPPARN